MISRYFLLVLFIFVYRHVFILPAAIAQSEPRSGSPRASEGSDAWAMAELFGHDLLSQNAAEICSSAQRLPPKQSYERLADWVLPSLAHPDFRARGAFGRQSSLVGQVEHAPLAPTTDLALYPESAWIHSPAMDLIELASRTGQLDPLRQRIESIEVMTPQQGRIRSSLLCMISIAQGELDSVEESFGQLFILPHSAADPQLTSERWVDLNVLWSAAANPATVHLISAELLSNLRGLQHYDEDLELDVLNDYLRLLRGRCEDTNARSALTSIESNRGFATFSYTDALSHGIARPLTRFFLGRGAAHKITGHETDFLTFRSPLSGDYEVDCEVATYPGAFTTLIVAGSSVEPSEDGSHVRITSLRKGVREIAMDPPLEPLGDWTRFSAAVRGGRATHFINGRAVYETQVEQTSAPWIALRSWRRAASLIRNLQISGASQLPDSVDLVTDAKLAGWLSYYGSAENGGLGRWRGSMADDQPAQMIGNQSKNHRGVYEEDLVRYLRPVWGDGAIEYEYLYEPDETDVHPSLGRLVFLLNPDGIRIHRLTDGRHESNDLRPDNVTSVNLDQRRPVPLVVNGWNRVQLKIEANSLSISVNGQRVYQHHLDAAHSRTFGLFHYADQTRAVVRNVSLKGQWPRSVPPLPQQELASKQIQQLDQSASDLSAEFVHDFRSGVPPRLFDFDGDRTSVTTNGQGIRLGRSEDNGVESMRVCLQIDGDFDIVAGYTDLEISPGKPTWHCGIGLVVTLDNSSRNRVAINRRSDRIGGKHCVAFGRQELNNGGKIAYVGGEQVVDESTSGKLRLARRGETMYALHAIDGSTSFRLIASATIPLGPIEIQGLKLITDIGQGLHTNVTWTRLEVRADKISTLDVDSAQATVAMLNQRRDRLSGRTLEFAGQGPDGVGFFPRATNDATVSANDRGIIAHADGNQGYAAAKLYGRLRIGPGFDVQTNFEISRLSRPIQSFNEVVLQVVVDRSDAVEHQSTKQRDVVEASIMLRHNANGFMELIPRVVGRDRLGGPIYRPIRSIPTTLPDMYRIVCHNHTLYYLYSETNSPEVRVAATYPLTHAVNAEWIILSANAATQGHTSEVCWKKVETFGDEIASPLTVRQQDLQQPPQCVPREPLKP